jgi:hypothetical protein
VLSLAILYRHVVLWDPGKFIRCFHPVPSLRTLAFDRFERSRHFHLPPPSDSRGETLFRGSTTVCFRYNLSICSPPCRSRLGFHPADGDFYFWALNGLVTLTAARYNYGGNWASSAGGTYTR